MFYQIIYFFLQIFNVKCKKNWMCFLKYGKKKTYNYRKSPQMYKKDCGKNVILHFNAPAAVFLQFIFEIV